MAREDTQKAISGLAERITLPEIGPENDINNEKYAEREISVHERSQYNRRYRFSRHYKICALWARA